MTEDVLGNSFDVSLVPHDRYGRTKRKRGMKNAPKQITNSEAHRGKKRSKNGCLSCKKLRIKVCIFL